MKNLGAKALLQETFTFLMMPDKKESRQVMVELSVNTPIKTLSEYSCTTVKNQTPFDRPVVNLHPTREISLR